MGTFFLFFAELWLEWLGKSKEVFTKECWLAQVAAHYARMLAVEFDQFATKNRAFIYPVMSFIQ